MTQPLHVCLAATPASARTMRERLRDWLDQAGVADPVGFDLVTACSEAFNNAVLYGVPGQPASVDVDGDVVAGTVVLSVHDSGGWPDFPSGREPGHKGYPIMRAFSDSVQVERSDEGTVVTLRRALAPSGSGEETPVVDGNGWPDPFTDTSDEAACRRLLVGIVEAAGVIDAEHVEGLETGVRQTLGAGAERLLVDLTQTTEITATGINVLLDARRRLLPRQGTIVVVLSTRLRRLFQTLDLDRRFLLCSSRRQAADLLGLTVRARPTATAGRARAA